MSKSWQEWINENIQRGCDPSEMGTILLKNKFTLPQVRKMMGSHLPHGFGKSESINPTSDKKNVDNAATALQRKSTSLLEIQRDLARLNPNARIIERRSGVSGQDFLEKYYSANRPVILCDLMTYWQATQKWTPEYLKAACGSEIVEIMAVREANPGYEADNEAHRQHMKFSDFVDMASTERKNNEYYLTVRNNFFSRPGVKSLLKDIETFTEYLRESEGDGMNMWYAPKGSTTPLQHDIANIFIAQVQGRQRIKLVPANELELVYNHYAFYSQVDINEPDFKKFPNFRHANIIEVELVPGEVLFIPVGWWHSITALDMSITVSFSNFLFPNHFKWEHPGNTKQQENY